MKKRILSALLALCLLISLATAGVSAAQASGTCGKNLTWSFNNGTLTISGTGDMYDFTAEGESPEPAPWTDLAAGITNVVIGSGVTSIGSQAFYGTSLTVVDLSNTNVTKIGSQAFNNSSLTDIVLPNGLTQISGGLFMNCMELKRVVIPNGVTSISAEAFFLCPKLDFLNIPASVEKIGSTAFLHGPEQIRFEGDVPEMVTGSLGTFSNMGGITVYYPKSNTTWNDDVFNAKWGGQVTWMSYTFVDVPFDAWFKASVDWATAENITQGTSESTFAPDDNCTRAQVVTFLWRAAGEPEPETTENPFTDVAATDYFYKAVLWAVENEITVGMGDGKFGSEETCTRAQVATFLWRSAGEPDASGSNPFQDVDAAQYYAKPVVWAVENEITQGDGSSTTFNPDGKCTRAQIVTFLYRFSAE